MVNASRNMFFDKEYGLGSSVQNIETRANGPRNIVIETNLFEGSTNVKVYVKSETTKQLLVSSGVSASQIVVIV